MKVIEKGALIKVLVGAFSGHCETFRRFVDSSTVQIIIHGLVLSYGVILAKVVRRFRVSVLEAGRSASRKVNP